MGIYMTFETIVMCCGHELCGIQRFIHIPKIRARETYIFEIRQQLQAYHLISGILIVHDVMWKAIVICLCACWIFCRLLKVDVGVCFFLSSFISFSHTLL